MRVLFPVSGAETASYFTRVVGFIAVREVTTLLVVHVLDDARRAGLERGRERFLDRRALAAQRLSDIEEAEMASGHEIVQRTAEALTAIAALPAIEIELAVRRGKTNEVIRDLAEQWNADVIVVRGRGGRPGPHSLGKTARFLIDHAPRAALLVRDPGDEPSLR